MRSVTETAHFLRLLVLGAMLTLLGGCSPPAEPLIVYAGKGLSKAVDEIKQNFEQREGIPVTIIYAGSDTLLSTFDKTRKGDIFIPGSPSYIKEAGDLITSDQYVAMHIPTFAVRTDNPKNLRSYADLLAPGVRIAVGNKDMNAAGRIAEAILKAAPPEQSFRANIVINSSTVNELLHLVKDQQVDAALLWSDILLWDAATGLTSIPIPAALNQPKEIRVCTLASSTNPQQAARFADYVAKEGQVIFEKHGFGKK